MSKTHTVKDLTIRYSVTTGTVLAWIKNGELKVFTVGRSLNKRKPRWRITEDALIAFELLRTPNPPPPRRRRRKQTQAEKFY